MQGSKFTEFFGEHKQAIIQGLVVVAIAVVVAVVVVTQFAPNKGVVTEYMSETDKAIQAASAHITTLIDEVNDIQAMDLVGHDDLVPITDQAAEHGANITALGTRVGEAEAKIQNHTDQLATIHASPPECYLTGNLTTGNLTLHAWASEAGNYTATLYLAYSPLRAVGQNMDDAVTTFYGSINWTATGATTYVPTVAYNGTDWGISQVSLNIGTFALTANNATAIAVPFGGLNSTYVPAYAYAEIYRVVK